MVHVSDDGVSVTFEPVEGVPGVPPVAQDPATFSCDQIVS